MKTKKLFSKSTEVIFFLFSAFGLVFSEIKHYGFTLGGLERHRLGHSKNKKKRSLFLPNTFPALRPVRPKNQKTLTAHFS
ncbi:MAG: hypothetical protein GX660_17925 [Clostridiaceae bacterium]|nr:hypothetical protein [Clostridiaceae bacterium]